MADPTLSAQLQPPKHHFKEPTTIANNKRVDCAMFGPSELGSIRPSWVEDRTILHLDCENCAEETWEVAETQILKGLENADIIQLQKQVEYLLPSFRSEDLTSDHAYRGVVCKYSPSYT
ncbi:hypothetical protein RHSIM_Rhsim11G0064000 [Rhododendron simsii]|uniref:Uncharacterized protein n=1 Tax=Rhododendron simsii TaxID=118357 RepID=A0A834LAE3_RHOSS|nr:hypothetical protein RHSIM_Rhsim11G0064000 [Rhododendron simsii]